MLPAPTRSWTFGGKQLFVRCHVTSTCGHESANFIFTSEISINTGKQLNMRRHSNELIISTTPSNFSLVKIWGATVRRSHKLHGVSLDEPVGPCTEHRSQREGGWVAIFELTGVASGQLLTYICFREFSPWKLVQISTDLPCGLSSCRGQNLDISRRSREHWDRFAFRQLATGYPRQAN